MNTRFASLITRRTVPLAVLSASVTVVSCLYLSRVYNRVYDDIITSPLAHVRELPQEEQDRLPYPPDDVLPGARDVDSPFGSIRVYEWGPESGRRVLLVHGISTPSIALASVAEELVEEGCRVMLFDLFGRGYSCTPNPVKYPQGAQLFTSQIFLVLASSPMSWKSFALIGYSLGGGIAANFTSFFPTLVDSLILIAPAGLMRQSRIHWTSKLIYGGTLPPSLVSWLVWRRLGGNNKTHQRTKSQRVKATDVVEEEMPSHPALSLDSPAPLSPRRPSVSVADAVAWQLRSHKGFLPAFISSIQHAPISNQHCHWERIASRLAEQKVNPENYDQGLREGKVLLILGKADDVVLVDEVGGDAKQVLGCEFVNVEILEGGHDLPIVAASCVTKTIVDHWNGV